MSGQSGSVVGRLGLRGRDLRILGLCAAAVLATVLVRAVDVGHIVPFAVSAVALALLARLIGLGVDALGDRLGAGLTGVVQSAFGNLPELFVVLFALHAGLVGVVQAAIVGSILANVLLVLGLAFLVGGLRHGPQRFAAGSARLTALMLVLAVAALLVPALTAALHSPAAGHEVELSRVVAVVLLVLFALSVPVTSRRPEPPTRPEGAEGAVAEAAPEHRPHWPLAVALGVLAVAGVGAGFVSEWFVDALEPAISALHLSQAFAGLVVVAIASNAVENVVGVQLAWQNRPDYALAVILQSPLQIALVLAPVLVLVAPLIGAASFTLVLPPLLIAALVLAVVVTIIVVLDGESTWFEGAALIALYAIIATAFWWG
ncbi:Ca2+:H+ antiporter [Amycolatopsis arida]|uniref:Ca(2+)/H(+) antiporter n=1 Tax=Amycolatopsis arida TaxID=587909 RepID=A0A1I5YWL6_9PSEU|nr:calcium/proton exchanger [Amycolatopsis arida]TDX89929.1 Ca2+:H+ antiporter [Amycolatopsis arida]SFQ48405.1 Ca2+:H+ antiporter [Amycolatopsis arida]